MGNNGSIPQQAVNTVRLIFFSLIAGCIMFAVVIFLTEPGREIQENSAFLFPGIAVALAGIFGVYFFTLKKAKSPTRWSSNHIIGYALAEGAIMMNLVFLFLGGDTTFLYVAGASLVALISRYPRNPNRSSDGQDLRSSGSFEP
ncbi:MAG: hypothetical protein CMF59_04640 [Leptospiraceae bacterium]|nr:hypothetical protein [Leptospiraceae bacterium]